MEDPDYGNTSTVTRVSKPTPKHIVANSIPEDIIKNVALNSAIEKLPKNYNFEIHKTLWRIRKVNATCVALQFPEGLLMYSCLITDILQTFGHVQVVILGDVTYGACCIDDLTALSLGCDFLVHYGHSCLVPIDVCQMPTLYVFVDIAFSTDHLITMLIRHFDPSHTHLVLAGTIQFSSAIQTVGKIIHNTFQSVTIPQAKPLSQGEVLGCTSPKLHIQTQTVSNHHQCGCAGADNNKTDSTTTPNSTCCRQSQSTTTSSSSCKSQINQQQQSSTVSIPTPSGIVVDMQQSNTGHGAAADGIPLSELYPEQNTDDDITQDTNVPNTVVNDDNSVTLFPDQTSNTQSVEQATTATTATATATTTTATATASPTTPPSNVICVFVADGRFHMESLMIQNPHIPRYFRYDPYNSMMTEESYDYEALHQRRYAAIQKAKTAKRWGLILGTLGRQGSTHILSRLEEVLRANNCQYTTLLLSEIFPSKLALLSNNIDAWVQIACPRLSIDWASGFTQPLLAPYEFFVCFNELANSSSAISSTGQSNPTPALTVDQHQSVQPTMAVEVAQKYPATWLPQGTYPMDFYSSNGGAWTNYFHRQVTSSGNASQDAVAGSSGVTSGRAALMKLRARKAAAAAAAAAANPAPATAQQNATVLPNANELD